ncbi:phage FluMu gp28-like protein [Blastomonas natatoria]|uniref:Phage FluMu gp28-like protein n=1 Tax=Blastomonas natatoria TaxID=34015 RepID=A0A2V3VB62_9SPHN|nr:terminase family protein [Blastomonas natatoria]PXW79003.1 phage FluMu gp28-like protein [Blastomonas natatoria]
MKLSPADQAKRDEEIRRREIQGDRAAAEAAIVRLPKGDLLLGYQQKTVDKLFAGTALLVIEKSRRIGLTWGVAAFAALKAASAVDAGGQNVWYMGYDKDMTLEFIEVCAMWARAFGLVAGELVEEEVLYTDENGREHGVKAFSIRFASGFRVTALPSVPRALRGKQGIVIIDEAAFHKNVNEVIKSAMALLIWGGQVVVISTHDGVANPFNVLLDEIRAGKRAGQTMKITFADAMEAGLYERVALVARTKGTELPGKEQWEAEIRAAYGEDAEEELDCVPKTGSGCLIALEDIIAAEHPECGLPDHYAGGLCYVGRDVARRRDGQVQYCMELIGDVLWQRDTYEESGQTFAHQDAFFDGLFLRRRVVQARVDQTGMGEKVVEDLIIKHGATRVYGELLTGPNRYDLAIGLKKAFEQRKVRIRSDAITRADLMALKKMGSEESGSVRIVNDGDVHADRFWAYALAWRAYQLGGALYEYFGSSSDSRQGMPSRAPQNDNRRDPRGTRMPARGAW